MYDKISDTPASAKTGDLNDDLGQIEYIFSDKTGTLTENKMEFRMCSIKNQIYGKMPSSNTPEVILQENYNGFKFYDQSLIDNLNNKDVQDFLEVISLCHTVIAKTDQDANQIEYVSSSPDEEALVIAARCFGYKFMSSKFGKYSLQKFGQTKEYQVVGINEFNAQRKRMSIVLRCGGEA